MFKAKEKFLISLFFVMNTLGIFVYLFDSSFYIKPSINSLIILLILNIMVFFAWITFSAYFHSQKVITIEEVNEAVYSSRKKLTLMDLGLILSLLIASIYFVLFFENFPFVNSLINGAQGETSRPDITGVLPYFWTFSILVTSFCIPLTLNMLLLAIKRSGRKNLFKIFSLIITLSLLSLALGNKSIILIVIFFILFFSSKPSLIKIISFAIIFIIVYALIKYSYYRDPLDFYQISESIFRRTVMINVSANGVILDNLVIPNKTIDDSFSHIKEYAFYSVYGYLPGGAPISFMVDILYRLPIFYLNFPLIFISFFLVLYVRQYVSNLATSRTYYAITYLMLYGAVIIASGSFLDFIFRSLIPAGVLILSDKIVVK